MKKRPRIHEVKFPAPILTIVVTPHYGSKYSPEPGLSVHVTASMSFIEGFLTRVAEAQAQPKKEAT